MFRPTFIANSCVQAGRTVVWCQQHGIDYDLRDVKNETTHPGRPACRKIRLPTGASLRGPGDWKSYDDDFLKACGIEFQQKIRTTGS
jgi:hypothetical protein